MKYIKLFEEYNNDNFWKWFKDSKVVDNKGEPLVVYHGSNSDFEEFMGDTFFTDDYFNADGYANGNYVYEVYLSIKRPLIVDCQNRKWDNINTEYGTTTIDVVANIDRSKYDGVIFINIKDSWIDDEDYQDASTVYVTFYSNQIKSAEYNNGDFNMNNPNIYENNKAKIADCSYNYFDIKTTGMKYYDGIITHDNRGGYGHPFSEIKFDKKNPLNFILKYMSKDEYGDIIHPVPIENKHDIQDTKIKKYMDMMRKGFKFETPMVDLAYKTTFQEGRHRVHAAHNLGCDSIPVYVFGSKSQLTKLFPNYAIDKIKNDERYSDLKNIHNINDLKTFKHTLLDKLIQVKNNKQFNQIQNIINLIDELI